VASASAREGIVDKVLDDGVGVEILINSRGYVLSNTGNNRSVGDLNESQMPMIIYISVSLNKEYQHEFRHLLINKKLVLLCR
jgi:hypothetical protein